MFFFFGNKAKMKRQKLNKTKLEEKNYSRRKKVLIASFLRRSQTLSEGEIRVMKLISEKAPSLNSVLYTFKKYITQIFIFLHFI
jgi:glucan phosphorylase